MGLEISELCLWVEDTFKIEIDDEAVHIATVGDLHRYVVDKLNVPQSDKRCATPKAFLMLRRTLADHLGVAEKSITTSSKLADLVPRRRRQAVWKRLEEAHQWGLPSLEEPGYVVIVAGLLCTLGFAAWVFLWAPVECPP